MGIKVSVNVLMNEFKLFHEDFSWFVIEPHEMISSHPMGIL